MSNQEKPVTIEFNHLMIFAKDKQETAIMAEEGFIF